MALNRKESQIYPVTAKVSWATLAIAVWSAIGCTQDANPPAVTIGFSYTAIGFKENLMTSLLEQFYQKHDDIRVTRMPLEGSTDVNRMALRHSLSLDAGTIDLFELDEIWTTEFAHDDLLHPLPRVLTDELKRRDLAATVEAAAYKGRPMALPFFVTLGTLFYRSDLLNKYGLSPPRTLADLLSQAKTIAAKENIDGFVWQGDAYEGLSCVFFEWYFNLGGTVQVVNERIVLEISTVEKTVSFMRDLLKQGVSPPAVLTYDETASLEHFRSGRAIFMRNWQSLSTEVSKGQIGENFDLAPMPGKGISLAGGFHLAVNHRSRHAPQAFELAKFLTSRNAQIDLLSKRLYAPVLLDLYEQRPLDTPQARTLGQLASRIHYRPRSSHYYPFSRMLTERLHAFLKGDSTPAQVARQIVEAGTESAKRLSE